MAYSLTICLSIRVSALLTWSIGLALGTHWQGQFQWCQEHSIETQTYLEELPFKPSDSASLLLKGGWQTQTCSERRPKRLYCCRVPSSKARQKWLWCRVRQSVLKQAYCGIARGRTLRQSIFQESFQPHFTPIGCGSGSFSVGTPCFLGLNKEAKRNIYSFGVPPNKNNDKKTKRQTCPAKNSPLSVGVSLDSMPCHPTNVFIWRVLPKRQTPVQMAPRFRFFFGGG